MDWYLEATVVWKFNLWQLLLKGMINLKNVVIQIVHYRGLAIRMLHNLHDWVKGMCNQEQEIPTMLLSQDHSKLLMLIEGVKFHKCNNWLKAGFKWISWRHAMISPVILHSRVVHLGGHFEQWMFRMASRTKDIPYLCWKWKSTMNMPDSNEEYIQTQITSSYKWISSSTEDNPLE